MPLGDADPRPHERRPLVRRFGESDRVLEVGERLAPVPGVAPDLAQHDVEPELCRQRAGVDRGGQRRLDEGACFGEATGVPVGVGLVDEVRRHPSTRQPLRQASLRRRCVASRGDRLVVAPEARGRDAACRVALHQDAGVVVADAGARVEHRQRLVGAAHARQHLGAVCVYGGDRSWVGDPARCIGRERQRAVAVAPREPAQRDPARQVRAVRVWEIVVVPHRLHCGLGRGGVAREERGLDQHPGGVVGRSAAGGGIREAAGRRAVAAHQRQARGGEQHVGVDVAARVEAPGGHPAEVLGCGRPAAFERIGQVTLERPLLQHPQLAAQHLAVHRMGERCDRRGAGDRDADGLLGVEPFHHVGTGQGDQVVERQAARDRQQVEGAPAERIDPFDACADELVERARHRHLGESPCTAVDVEHPTLTGQVDHLVQHLEVAGRHLGEALARGRLDRPVEHSVEERDDVVVRQRRHLLDRQVAVLDEGLDHTGERPPGPDGGHQEHGALQGQREQQREAGVVELVDVVDQQQQPLTSGRVDQCDPRLVEQGDAVVVAEPDVAGELGRQQVGEGPERDRLRGGVPDGTGVRAWARHREQFLTEPGLADPGGAGEHDAAAGPVGERAREVFDRRGAGGQRPLHRHRIQCASRCAAPTGRFRVSAARSRTLPVRRRPRRRWSANS